MQQAISIKLPQCNKNTYITTYAQIRPYRKGGIRLDRQIYGDKEIYHDYGHGGAGISLAYGSTQVSIRQFEKNITTKNSVQCAVIGAGIVGLTTAIQLAKRGHKVQIYASKISKLGQKDNNNCITSQVAPGLWFPYTYDISNPQQNKLISKLSYDYYLNCITTKKYKSLSKAKAYNQSLSQQTLKEAMPWINNNNFGKVKLRFVEGGLAQEYMFYETVKINVESFLQQLKIQAYQNGVKMNLKHFNQKSEINELKEKYIFNCTAIGAKKLFNDNNMAGVRGHLLEFVNNNPENVNFFLIGNIYTNPNNKDSRAEVHFYCHRHRILVGVTREEGQQDPKVNEQTAQRVFKNMSQYLSQKIIKPKL